ncbi:MAG: fibronectin type III domain-containing protein [Candidatus Omnitrophota bacterium]
MTKKHLLPPTVWMILVICVSFFSLNCGKKGPLRLEPQLTPPEVTNFTVSQEGSNLNLRWEFPLTFKDKKKTPLDVQNIDRIQICYSDKEIKDGQFEKKCDVLQKLKFTDVTRITDAKAMNASNASDTDDQAIAYSTTIPFKLKNLENKDHYFAIQYNYRKEKSPLSSVVYIRSLVPVKPVSGLKIIRENKVIKLTWEKPLVDEVGKPVSMISGYNIFKKIVPDGTAAPSIEKVDQKVDQKETKAVKLNVSEGYTQINKNPTLIEYFEDSDCGVTGTYSYFVTTAMSNQIESSPSEAISIPFTDTYAPDVPSNLVSFKAADHIFLTWQEVKDTDLSHYRVYRKLSETDDYKLMADKITIPNYKDKDVKPGKTYFYSVTSVDKAGNESNHSSGVSEQF